MHFDILRGLARADATFVRARQRIVDATYAHELPDQLRLLASADRQLAGAGGSLRRAEPVASQDAEVARLLTDHARVGVRKLVTELAGSEGSAVDTHIATLVAEHIEAARAFSMRAAYSLV